MKHVKIAECARRALVALLMVSMLFSSMPTGAIASALPLPAAADAEGALGDDSSQGEWNTSVEPLALDAEDGEGDEVAKDDVIDDNAAAEAGEADKSAADAPSGEAADDPAAPDAGTTDDAAGTAQDTAVDPDEVIDGSKLEDAELVEAPELTAEERAELLPGLNDDGTYAIDSDAALPVNEGEGEKDDAQAAAHGSGDRATEPSEADGTKIERVSVEWITGNAGQGKLTVAPSTDDPQDVRMRMNVAFSGQHDYDPGTMRLTVPKSIFTYRDGSIAGSMTTSVPEAPDTRALFSYVELDDSYVLTNTRKLSAATSAMFEFTIHDIVPHQMVGNPSAYTSDPFWAKANVTTAQGTVLGLKSNEIKASFDTSEKIVKAESSVSLLTEAWDSEWPSELKPSNAGSYVYCDFYSWATVQGNQEFKIEVAHAATVAGSGATVLGLRDQDGKVYNGGGPHVLRSSGYTANDTRDFYVHAYVAVPKSRVPDNGKYAFKDTATYKVTSVDDKQQTTASGSSEQVYAPLSFVNPGGHFNVFKSGSIAHREDENTYQWGDADPLALNDLRDGREILSTWQVETLSFNAPWTAPNGKPTEVNQMEQRKVKTVTDDTSVQFNNNGRELTSADFEFASIKIPEPEVYRYEKFTENTYGWSENSKDGYVVWQKIAAGTFGYKPVTDKAKIPDVEVWGQVDGGSWQHLATVNWTSGAPRLTHAASGVSLSDTTVVFNKGMNITDVRTVINTERSGIIYYTYPTVRLKPTANIKQQVEQLFKNSTSPSTSIRNKAVMSAYQDGGNGSKILTTQVKAADNKLSGVSLGVRAFKSMTQENDTPNRLARLHYTTKVREQTNLISKEQYNEAIDRGIIKPETSGTFYDLLPKHVIPNLDSIKLRKGDSLRNAYTVENYKGSGRTLLVVEAVLSPQPKYKKAPSSNEDVSKDDNVSITGEAGYCDVIQLDFDAVYTWEDMTDLGVELNNVIAFESGNDSLGTMKGLSGEPDNPLAGKNETSAGAVKGVEELMTDLNPNHDNPVFVYGNCRDTVSVDVSALTGLQKHVSVNNDGVYGEGLDPYALNVYEGGAYTYRLRIQNDDKTKLKGVILYDDLENFVPTQEDGSTDAGDRQWRGVLQSVDVSSLVAQGVEPVVYYSTKADLTLDDESDVGGKDGTLKADLDLENGDIWSTEKPSDPAKITGIAIDCRKTEDGEDFVLEPSMSMGALIKMKAPVVSDLDQTDAAQKWFDTELEKGDAESDDDGLRGGAHAYNNVSRVAWEINETSGSTSEYKLVRKDYTKVGLLNGSIVVKKVWDDGDDQDGKRPKSVTVHLLANGRECGMTAELSDANGWQHTFEGVRRVDDEGHAISYSLREDDVPGYAWGVSWDKGSTGSDPQIATVTNTYPPEKTSVSGVKTWEDAQNAAGRRPESVKIDLYRIEGDVKTKIKSKTVRADSQGEWSYTFDNLDKYYDHGKLVQYEVHEDTYYAGYAPESDGTNVKNVYDPFGDLTVSKEVLGITPLSANASFTFRLDLETPEGKPDAGQYDYVIVADADPGTPLSSGRISNGGTFQLQNGQTATIKEIPSESTYSVIEEKTPGFVLTGRVGNKGDIKARQTAHAEFTNTYSASGAVRLQANKQLEGRDLEAYQFRFDLLNASGEVIRTASNDANGSVLFGNLRYTLDDLGSDGTASYRYTIREQKLANDANGAYVTDEATYGAQVNIRDNGDGTIATEAVYDGGSAPTFHNSYSAKGSIVLRAWKELKSGDLNEYGPFTFALIDDATGQQAGAVKQNDENGTVEFDPISFTEKDAGKTFTYTAYEVEGDDNRVVYDDARFAYSVTVVDNGDGTLSFEQTNSETPIFENTLEPGKLRIEKRTEGNGDPDQEFTFHVKLTAEQGQKLPEGEVEFERVQLAGARDGDATAETENAVDAADFADGDAAVDDKANGKSGDAAGEAAEGNDAPAPEEEPTPEPDPRGDDVKPEGDDAAGVVNSIDETADGDETRTASAPVARVTPQSGKVPYGTATWSLADGTLTVNSGTITNEPGLNNSTGWLDSALASQVTKIVFNNTQVKFGNALLKNFSNVQEIAGSINLSGCKWSVVSSMENDGVLSMMFAGTEDSLQVLNVSLANAQNISLENAFLSCNKLETVRLAMPNSTITDTNWMFAQSSKLQSIDLDGGFDTSQVRDMSDMFYRCSSLTSLKLGSGFDTSKVLNMTSMFRDCSALVSLDLGSRFNTSSVTSMFSMFTNCSSLASLNLGNQFDTSSVTDMTQMFFGCSSLASIDLGLKFDTSSVTDMGAMFCNCSSLMSLDLGSRFNTSSVADTHSMFRGCSSLAHLDLGTQFDTSNAEEMQQMFDGCEKLKELDLSGFNFTNARNISWMFASCEGLESVCFTGSPTSKLTKASYFLYRCPALTEIDLDSFTLGPSVDMTGFFPSFTTNPCTITLGGGWRFNSDCKLPRATSNSTYTGKWVRDDMPGTSYTPTELAEAWNSSMAGTYVWEKKPTEYTVAFNANASGDAVSGSMPSQTWNIGTYGTIPECTFRRFGYDFEEWNTRSNGSGTPYQAGQKLNKDLTSTAGTTVTLYAQWTPWDNTITINDGEFDITLHGGEAAIISDLPAGVGYVVTEQVPGGWQLIESSGTTGAIKPNDTAVAKFKNRYTRSSTSAVIETRKLLDGKPAKAGMFEFALYEVLDPYAGKMQLIEKVKNSEGGGVVFTPIRYDSRGTHEYRIYEVDHSSAYPDIQFDGHYEPVKVDVTLASGGVYEATVTYLDCPPFPTPDPTPDQSLFLNTTKPGKLTVVKNVQSDTGIIPSDKSFQFRIDWNGGKTWSTFELKAGESKTFDDLVPGTTYEVTEIGMPDGYKQVGIVGGDNNDGSGVIASRDEDKVQVYNRYSATGSAVIQANKVLEGAALEDGQFTFELTGSGGFVSRASNGADGTVTFDAITYDVPGTYEYTIREVQGSDDKIVYSKEEYKVSVAVTDTGNGNLETKVAYGDDASATPPTFINKAKPGGTLKLSKQVVNGTEATKDADFNFTVKLMDIDGKELDGTYDYAKSDGSSGSIASGGKVKLKAGEHVEIKVPLGTTYEITEAEAPGFESSSENASGSVPSGDVVEVKFTNTYDATGSFVPVATKVLEGGGLKDGQFTFRLLDEDGEIIQTVTNDKDGKVEFSPIDYVLADDGKVFLYRMVEVDDRQANIEYDGNEVIINVEVSDKGDGTLGTNVTYDGKDAATFTNRRLVVMPETGQAGIIAGVVVGMAILGVSAYVIIRRKKR